MVNDFYRNHRLQTITLIWLNIIMLISVVIASVVGLFWQNHFQRQQSFSMIDNYLISYVGSIDVAKSIDKEFDEWMTDAIDGEDTEGKETFFDDHRLERISVYNRDKMSEISVVNANGIITHSSNPMHRGYDIKDDERLAPFMCLLDGETSFGDSFETSPFDGSKELAYLGRTFRDNSGFMLFGINEYNYSVYWQEQIAIATEDTRLGMTGYIINCDMEKHISSVTHTARDVVGDTFEEVSLLPETDGKIKESMAMLYGSQCYVSAMKTPDYYVIGAYPVAEADQFEMQNNILYVILFFVILNAFFVTLFELLKRIVIKDVEKTHASLKRITAGDLDERVTAGGSLEFVELSDGINETVDRLKDLIEEEKRRIRTELENAKNIQESAVPQVFPEDERFGLYALMDTAEAVGGDFYDFFMTDANTLAIVMADVSGKGMPAALYMMRAKTLIKTYADQGLPVEEVARAVNAALCEEKSANMFVTVWLGFLKLDTGVLEYVHAGHTMPVLVGSEVSFINQKKDVVMGGLKKAKYLRQEVTLSPGDGIFLYTDGVTEARDVSENMYGNKRLLDFISREFAEIDAPDANGYCKAACEMVYDDVKAFVSDAKQFDDITMMMVKVNGDGSHRLL